MEKLVLLLFLTILAHDSSEVDGFKGGNNSPFVVLHTIDGKKHLYRDLETGHKYCYQHLTIEFLEKRVDKL
jgi:hypothetical protein